jgi:hypothetical protein
MKYILLALTFLLTVQAALYAGDAEFKKGFEEGYRIEKDDLVIVPVTPIRPITPIGSTDYREGIKAGMRAGKKKQ